MNYPLARKLRPLSAQFYTQLNKRLHQGRVTPTDVLLAQIGTCAIRFGGVALSLHKKDFVYTYREPMLEIYNETLRRGATADLEAVAAEMYAYHASLRECDVPPTFQIQEDLAYCFLSTDVRGLQYEDLHFPYTAWILDFPDEVLYGHHVTPIRALLIQTAGVATGEGTGLLITAIASNPAKAEYVPYAYAIPVAKGNDLEEQQAEWDTRFAETTKNARFYCGNKTLSFAQGFNLVRRYVLNFLLYIAAKPDSIDYANPERTKKLKAKGNRAHRFEKEELVGLEAMHRVTTDVAIDPGIKDAVLDSGGGATWSLKYKTWVRGHWRKQACGEGRKDRKLIFIAPHVRGKDLEEGLVTSHTYKVQ